MDASLVRRRYALIALLAAGCQNGPSSEITGRGQAPVEPPAVIRIQGGRPVPGPVSPAAPVAKPADPAVTPAASITSSTSNSTVVQASGPSPKDAETQIRIVATIGPDVVVTDDEVWTMVRQRAREYVQLPASERAAKEKDFFREELRRLIERELVIADFMAKVKKNRPQAVEEIRDEAQKAAHKQMKAFRQENGLASEAQFLESLRAQGLSQKGILRQLERGAMMNMYLGQLMKEKVRTPGLAEVALYYQQHPDEFHVDDRIKWLDLFVSYRRFNTDAEAMQYAKQLHQQAEGGADFVKLVKERGHGDSVLRDGEGIGHKRGEIQPKDLEPALLVMKTGELSPPIQTETGIHILKVVERTEAGVRPFDEKTQMAIRERLMQLSRKAEFDKLIEDLWRKTTVQVIGLP